MVAPAVNPSSTGQRRDPAAVLAASTFSAGMQLLPQELYGDAHRLYCVLRTLDDFVDERDQRAEQRIEAVERWAYGQGVTTPETRELADLSRRYPLSRQALIDFCAGMRHDLAEKSIDNERELELYCRQVGGTVGVMLVGLFGASHPDCEEKMAMLGAAMQRTNILRDIDEDLSCGRLFIARTTIRRFGFPAPGAREALLRDQIARADMLYDEGIEGVSMLCKGRLAMGVSTVLYREILRQIERDGYGRKPGRVIVPLPRRRQLVAEYRLRAGEERRPDDEQASPRLASLPAIWRSVARYGSS